MKLTLDFNFKNINASHLCEIGVNIMQSLVVMLDKKLVLSCVSYAKDLDFYDWYDAPKRDQVEMLNLLFPDSMDLTEDLSRLIFNPDEDRNWTPLLSQLRFDRVLNNDVFKEMVCSVFDLKPADVDTLGFHLGLELHYSGEPLETDDSFYKAFDAEEVSGPSTRRHYSVEYSARAGIFWGRLIDWTDEQRVARVWLPKVTKPRFMAISGNKV